MMAAILASDHAAVGYDCIAPFYDQFTADYAHDAWVGAIEQRALALGLRGSRALDLACGTGESTRPLLSRGYSVLGCDISEGMIDRARVKLPELADAFCVADMRDLPDLGEFDLVLCLDDAVNYLLTDTDLEATFAGVARVLAPGGIFAFDVNSLLTYRTAFAQSEAREEPGLLFAWRGQASPTLRPAEGATAILDVFAAGPDGLWEQHTMRNVQRHHPRQAIGSALAGAGLRLCAIYGQHPGAILEEDTDEESHIKLVYFAKRQESHDVRR
jgi:SAM-dependent methyltransferase